MRTKEGLISVLEDIPGIGPKRRKSLLGTFGSPEKIRNATIEELAGAPQMTLASARRVYEFFHPPGQEPHSVLPRDGSD